MSPSPENDFIGICDGALDSDLCQEIIDKFESSPDLQEPVSQEGEWMQRKKIASTVV